MRTNRRKAGVRGHSRLCEAESAGARAAVPPVESAPCGGPAGGGTSAFDSDADTQQTTPSATIRASTCEDIGALAGNTGVALQRVGIAELNLSPSQLRLATKSLR